MEHLILNRAALDLLAARSVFHKRYGGERWVEGDALVGWADTELEPYVQIFSGGHLPRFMGAFSYSQSALRPHVRVGRYCSIGLDVRWMGPPHPIDWVSSSPFFYDRMPALPALAAYRARYPSFEQEPRKEFEPQPRRIGIGHDVWIGDQTMVAPGVKIGHGAVIGARSLVMKDVEPFTVAVGAPAKAKRLRFPERIVEGLLASEWWDFAPETLQPLSLEEPERFLAEIAQRVAGGARRMAPVPLTWAELRDAAAAPSAS